jgi:hypothetical protein
MSFEEGEISESPIHETTTSSAAEGSYRHLESTATSIPGSGSSSGRGRDELLLSSATNSSDNFIPVRASSQYSEAIGPPPTSFHPRSPNPRSAPSSQSQYDGGHFIDHADSHRYDYASHEPRYSHNPWNRDNAWNYSHTARYPSSDSAYPSSRSIRVRSEGFDPSSDRDWSDYSMNQSRFAHRDPHDLPYDSRDLVYRERSQSYSSAGAYASPYEGYDSDKAYHGPSASTGRHASYGPHPRRSSIDAAAAYSQPAVSSAKKSLPLPSQSNHLTSTVTAAASVKGIHPIATKEKEVVPMDTTSADKALGKDVIEESAILEKKAASVAVPSLHLAPSSGSNPSNPAPVPPTAVAVALPVKKAPPPPMQQARSLSDILNLHHASFKAESAASSLPTIAKASSSLLASASSAVLPIATEPESSQATVTSGMDSSATASAASNRRPRVAWGQGVLQRSLSAESNVSVASSVNLTTDEMNAEPSSSMTSASSTAANDEINNQQPGEAMEVDDPKPLISDAVATASVSQSQPTVTPVAGGSDLVGRGKEGKDSASATFTSPKRLRKPAAAGDGLTDEDGTPTAQRKRGRKIGSKVVDGHVVRSKEILPVQTVEENILQEAATRSEEVVHGDSAVAAVTIDNPNAEMTEDMGMPVITSIDEANPSLSSAAADGNGSSMDQMKSEPSKKNQENAVKKLQDVFDAAASSTAAVTPQPAAARSKATAQNSSSAAPPSLNRATSTSSVQSAGGRGSASNLHAGRGLVAVTGRGGRGSSISSAGRMGRGGQSSLLASSQQQQQQVAASNKKQSRLLNASNASTAAYLSAYPAQSYHLQKSRALLINISGSSESETIYRAFHAIRYMVELQQYASSDRTDYSRLLTISHPQPPIASVLKIPIPSKQEICCNLDIIERGNELLWEHLLDCRRKQFVLEGMISSQSNQSQPVVALPAADPLAAPAPAATSVLVGKKSPLARAVLQSKATITTIFEQNNLRIAEAHLFVAPLPASAATATAAGSPSPIVTPQISPSAASINNPVALNKHPASSKAMRIHAAANATAQAHAAAAAAKKAAAASTSTNSTTPLLDAIALASASSTMRRRTGAVLLEEATSVTTLKQKLKKQRSVMTSAIRTRKLARIKAWRQLGDQYYAQQSSWLRSNPHAIDLSTLTSSSSSGGEQRSSLNSAAAATAAASSLGAMRSSGRLFPSSQRQVMELLQLEDYSHLPISQQPLSLAEKLPLVTTTCPSMLSPWLGSSIATPPAANTSASAGVMVAEMVDIQSNRLTCDARRQLCQGLDNSIPCPVFCNCAYALDRKERYANPWTDAEKAIFVDKFVQYPKNFNKISRYLHKKSVKDCIAFYYDSKANIHYKHLLKEIETRKR